ncbi:50S ribosomal protein L29 [Candidatus Curtissbacteria bacterium RIFCSPHIGHO2_12_FULL_38_9b]|uniref:Large ribosomal subunit protein uL29 n=2 Tax=Candidatus Curtissiibacteriota TaxID=1752717 RepID=A0A1F5GXK6_9BACT|nr:MAG: 50S ribosomal protein L29 [Candidatus Curtissbacteria bacterium RIFCSPLOWO2_01_FULL_37_9]OGD96535.1 MAG: 50S ribosomal protein L29 [Candidatus Curtissbacteria bacterium RIFCSPHIGHO2_12_FULL_38_9b]
MKKQDFSDYKKKSIIELVKKITELEKQKLEKLIEFKMGKLKNVHSVGLIKKDIARIRTIINFKYLAEKAQRLRTVNKSAKEDKNAVN